MKPGVRIIGLLMCLLVLHSFTGTPLDRDDSGGSVFAASPSLKIIAAGVPYYLGQTRDYDAWFTELAAAGVTVFLPFSEYQEVPEVLSLGYEADFFPPCSYEDPAFQALRAHHIKLLAAGQLLYASGFPAVDPDPLRVLMQCAGEGMISAVLSIDEPGLTQTDAIDPAWKVRALYEHVKALDPTLPVMMVNAPIPAEITESDGTIRTITQPEIDAYLQRVEAFSAYADQIGFDLYPIPVEIASLIAPGLGLKPVGYDEAFPAYLEWLKTAAHGRPYFLTLQAFSFERQLSSQLVAEARNAGYNLRFPTETELRDMACLAVEGGVTDLAWWGQSLLIQEDEDFWERVLTVTHHLTTDASAYCRERFNP